MKLVWINIIAVIIAISSLVVEKPSIQADFSLPASLAVESHLNSDDLRNDSQKNSEKTPVIAQSFMAIVVIADELNVNETFLHYLPLYRLNRLRDFFLLI